MIDVEFVEPDVPSQFWWGVLAVLGVLALGIWGAVAWQSTEHTGLARELNAARAAIEEASRKAASTDATPPPYAAAALEVWKRGRFEVGQAMTAIETVRVPGVAVQSIEIANDEGVAKVEILADDVLSLNRYLDDLNGGLAAPQWRIVQVTSSSGPQGGVRAVISSRW